MAGLVPAIRTFTLGRMHEADRIIGLYERHAHAFDAARGQSLIERPWLDRFLALVPRGGSVLDLGCGAGEPIARHVIASGCAVTGVDSSPTMIALCQSRFPDARWIVADMRTLSLGRRFDGLLAWDSFFHLLADDQRKMFAVFRDHAAPGAALLFTSGPRAGVAMGTFEGEPLHHASLDPAEYCALLAAHGFKLVAHVAEDSACGGHTVWLARAAVPVAKASCLYAPSLGEP
jgi:trans-aconitate methyltransferase